MKQWLVGAAGLGLLVMACASSGGGASSSGSGPASDAGVDAHAEAGIIGPPQIERMAYYAGARGPRLLVRGVDREPADLLTLRLEFLDAAGAPVLVDLGSGTPDTSELLVNAMATLEGGVFLVDIQSALGFDAQVKAIAATPRGRPGKGTRQVAALGAPPERAIAAPCDVVFDACASGGICAPSGGEDRCLDGAQVRATRCAAAATLAVGASTLGSTGDVSFWEPPLGCVSAEARGGPEGLVTVHVAEPTAELTVSTDSPDTDFDTVLSIYAGCSGGPLACNDDAAPPRSKITLRDVAPGDYLVVVDSIGAKGGHFRLSATSKP